jgi:Ca2+-binding RTX toxin-like protein
MKKIFASCAALLGLGLGYGGSAFSLTIGTTNDPNTLTSALVGPGGAINVTSVSYSGAATASGTYSDGPLGIADGAIFTSGAASLALPPSEPFKVSQENNVAGDALCDALIPGFPSKDAAKLTINFDLAPGFSGISFQSIFGSEEYPEFVGGAFNDVYAVYLDGVQIVFDANNDPITINGPFFGGGSVVVPPVNGSEYDGSTGLLTTQALAAVGAHVLEIVICDGGDQAVDSGVFVAKLDGCVGSCSGTVACEEIDDDNDGSNSCVDCDDTDPSVNPGEDETCDSVDNDCDGEIDEDDVCTPEPAADVSAAISDAADPTALGGSTTYTLTVANAGPDPATGTSAATTFSGASAAILAAASTQGSCSTAGSTVTCTIGTLASSASATVTITVEPNATGTVTATAAVSAAEADPALGNNSAVASTTVNNGNGCTITGTAGNDTLNGGNGNDIICGLGGNDTINGKNGNDTIFAGSGNDIISGGNGDDTLFAGPGDDRSYGENIILGLLDNGNDMIFGGPGNDDLDGQNGSDTLVDEEGTDTLTGGLGPDTIDLQDGVGGDTANGGLGNDTCLTDGGDTQNSC